MRSDGDHFDCFVAQIKALCNTLEVEGYATTGYSSARQALASLREGEVDMLLTELMMPEMDGISLLKAAREIDGNLAGVMMTGHGTIDTAVKAMQHGAGARAWIHRRAGSGQSGSRGLLLFDLARSARAVAGDHRFLRDVWPTTASTFRLRGGNCSIA